MVITNIEDFKYNKVKGKPDPETGEPAEELIALPWASIDDNTFEKLVLMDPSTKLNFDGTKIETLGAVASQLVLPKYAAGETDFDFKSLKKAIKDYWKKVDANEIPMHQRQLGKYTIKSFIDRMLGEIDPGIIDQAEVNRKNKRNKIKAQLLKRFNTIDDETADELLKADASSETGAYISTSFIFPKFEEEKEYILTHLDDLTKATKKFIEMKNNGQLMELPKAYSNVNNYRTVQSFVEYFVNGITPEFKDGVDASAKIEVASKDPIDLEYEKHSAGIDRETFEKLCQLDPTTDDISVGEFLTKFLIPMYQANPEAFQGQELKKLKLSIAVYFGKSIKERTPLKAYNTIEDFLRDNEAASLAEPSATYLALKQNNTLEPVANRRSLPAQIPSIGPVKDTVELLCSSEKFDVVEVSSHIALNAISHLRSWNDAHARDTSYVHNFSWCVSSATDLSFISNTSSYGTRYFAFLSKDHPLGTSNCRKYNFLCSTNDDMSVDKGWMDGSDLSNNRLADAIAIDPTLLSAMVSTSKLFDPNSRQAKLAHLKTYLIRNPDALNNVSVVAGDLTVDDTADRTAIANKLKFASTITFDCEVVEQRACANNAGLTAVILTDKVKRIEPGAFWNCANLQSIKLSKNLEYIGTGAFYNCTSLTGNIILRNKLNAIGEQAFYGTKLKIKIAYPRAQKLKVSQETFEWIMLNQGGVIKIDGGTNESLEEDYELFEELLDENIPPDLAKAYKTGTSYYVRDIKNAHDNDAAFYGSDTRRWANYEYSAASYEVLTPEEALEFVGLSATRQGDTVKVNRRYKGEEWNKRVRQLRILMDGGVYAFDPYYVPGQDSQQRPMGAIMSPRSDPLDLNSMKSDDLKKPNHLYRAILQADKIYKTDEFDHPLPAEFKDQRQAKGRIIRTSHLDTDQIERGTSHNPIRDYTQGNPSTTENPGKYAGDDDFFWYSEFDSGSHDKTVATRGNKRANYYWQLRQKKKELKQEYLMVLGSLKRMQKMKNKGKWTDARYETEYKRDLLLINGNPELPDDADHHKEHVGLKKAYEEICEQVLLAKRYLLQIDSVELSGPAFVIKEMGETTQDSKGKYHLKFKKYDLNGEEITLPTYDIAQMKQAMHKVKVTSTVTPDGQVTSKKHPATRLSGDYSLENDQPRLIEGAVSLKIAYNLFIARQDWLGKQIAAAETELRSTMNSSADAAIQNSELVQTLNAQYRELQQDIAEINEQVQIKTQQLQTILAGVPYIAEEIQAASEKIQNVSDAQIAELESRLSDISAQLSAATAEGTKTLLEQVNRLKVKILKLKKQHDTTYQDPEVGAALAAAKKATTAPQTLLDVLDITENEITFAAGADLSAGGRE